MTGVQKTKQLEYVQQETKKEVMQGGELQRGPLNQEMTETRELEHKGIKGYCKYTLYDQKDRGKYEHCEEK